MLAEAIVGRHDLRDDDQNPVIATGETNGQGGRHSRDVMDAPTDVIPRVADAPEARTDRIFADAMRWLETQADDLWTLTDTQPIPLPQFPTTDPDAPDSEVQVERERARDVALNRTPSRIDPRDPEHLALLLDKLQRWTPKPKNPQERRD